ncbi:MAG: tryptophan synthase subunit alpha [Gammaproteobacteria bacterium]
MNRYAERFEVLAANGRGAFIPFTVLGFPDAARCAEQLDLLAEHGDALELGIPFSDPVADGATIQRAATAALQAGATPTTCLGLVAKLRERHPALPIGLLVYANLVVHRGLERFYADVAAAGADSVLVADVPGEEGAPFAEAARAAGVAPVFIAPPNADTAALDRIATLGAGYTYVLTRAGVTGAEQAAGAPAAELLKALAERNAPPPVLGFGISRPEQVHAGIEAGAAGVISGSAVVTRLRALAAGEMRVIALAEWLSIMHLAAVAGETGKIFGS